MPRTHHLAPLAFCALTLAACATTSRWEPTPTATLSTAPGAKGYLVVGLAEENAHNELLSSFQSFNLLLDRLDAKQGAMAQRYGCTSLAGMAHDQTCAGQSKMTQQVLELTPGEWSISGVMENLYQGFPARLVTITAPFPKGTHFTVAPGRITYIGDFLFSVDPEAQSIVLKTHTRDDDAAPHALDNYPGLRSAITYQDPAAPR